QTIFDKNRRDVVLDISDVVEGRINPKEFFEEKYLTEGMNVLFHEAFRRFAKESDSLIIKLSQICVVISDLKATYEGGSQKIIEALYNFEQEVCRGSMNPEPMCLNTDAVYPIATAQTQQGIGLIAGLDEDDKERAGLKGVRQGMLFEFVDGR
ncbi:MAG: hypothetical protein KAW93_02810, partial [Methanogenium sp.]|nr:hypothetical protein [Methanogenium sp.]